MVKGHTRNILLLALMLSVSTGVGAVNVFADENVDFSITVAPSLSLSVSSNSVNLPITPVSDGAFGKTFFTVTSATNNMYGYTLNMTNGTSYLESTTVNPTTGTKPHIETLATGSLAESTFSTATTAADGLNRWGIAVVNGNYDINSTSAVYNLASTTATAIKSTNTNNTTSDTTSIVVASNLNLEVPAGVYTGTFNLQMVVNPNVGTLEDAYQIAGKTKKTVGNESYYSIQDMNPGICAAAAQSNMQVVDERDNTIYWIGKLADERCWLLDNLALDLTDTNVKNVMYNSSDSAHNTMTNATNEQLGYLFNGGRVDGDSTTNNLPTTGVTNWITTSNSYSYSQPLISLSNKNEIQNLSGSDSLNNLVSVESWKIGVYYNYCAVSAGSYCYGNGENSAGTPYGDVMQDICPASWRVPTGGEDGDYQVLIIAYPSVSGGDSQYIRFRKALRLPLSGFYYHGNNQYNVNDGVVSYLWSSNYYGNKSMYSIHVESITPSINVSTVENRRGGLSVRCIAKTGTESASSSN